MCAIMADNILFSTLDGHIPLEDVLAWISNKNTDLPSVRDFGCNRGDFVLFFLNFIHQGTARPSTLPKYLQNANRSGRKASQPQLSSERNKSHSTKLLHSSKDGCSSTSFNKNVADVSKGDPQDGKAQSRTFTYGSELENLQDKASPVKCQSITDSTSSPQEMNSFVTSSPVSCRIASDRSPQLTPIQKNSQTSRFPETKSSSSNSPDLGGRYSHKSSGLCLGDFLVRDGKSHKNNHSKKRLSGSPPKSPADFQSSMLDGVQTCNSNKKKQRRRINPTKVNTETLRKGSSEAECFGELNPTLLMTSPFQDPANFEPASASNSFTEERNLLKQERLKLQGDQLISQPGSVTTPSKFSISKSVTVAEPRKVTFHDELLKFSSIYCCILDANLIPNLMTELYFILQLLVIQDHQLDSLQDAVSTEVETALKNFSVDDVEGSGNFSECSNDQENSESPMRACRFKARKFTSLQIFCSVHNCVFFASKVLQHVKDVLGCLDRITLKLLLENERLAKFSPDLSECLSSLVTTASCSSSGLSQVACKPVVSKNVAFQSETDNSSNFPCAQSFSNFRKQRDSFYDLIRIWEANHMTPGWSFASALGSRVRTLLQLCSDPSNYMHLARLFRLQLIGTAHGEPSIFDEESLEDTQLQECLKGIDPDKLIRLRERLVTPQKTLGPRPPPSFPGIQEFYHDFIICAYNSAFVQHLQDGFISHLLELNQTIFVASDMEDSDSSVDEVTKHEYKYTISTMQLLAKFLGFVVFYPYNRTDGKISEKILDTEIALRSKVFPPIDVLSCVVEAHKNHRLIVTIPWIVKYLGMMDIVSSALPIYRATLRVLLYIYVTLSHKSDENICQEDGCVLLSPYSVLFLRMCLGWLFDASIIQDTVFYSCCFNLDDSILSDHPFMRVTVASELSLSALNSCATASLTSNVGPPVDALNLIDNQVLYALCPYLRELRALLTSAPTTRSNPGNAIRHITPVSTSFSASSPSSTNKQLELQLEENFFHNLPASVHRTVEFVEERVTSSCVKHICNVWLRSLKEQGIEKLQQKIKSSWDDIDNSQDALFKEVQTILDEVSVELKVKCRAGIHDICLGKCRGALSSLLSEETLSSAVCDMCVAIATRTCVERVVLWMQTHASLSMYGKELQNEVEKALKHGDRCDMVAVSKTSHIAPGSNATWTHNDSAPSPFEVLQELKLLVCNALDGQDTRRELIDNVLDKIEQTVIERQDVVPAAERVLALLSVDLVVALACHFPSLLDSALLNRMVTLWKLDALRPVEDGLARLVCPRNMLLLAQSHHPPRIVWEKLADVVVAVLKAELVTPDLVENQCLAIMQQEWPQNILRCFSMCMSEVVRQYQKLKNVDYKFVLLLEWLAETMAQIDYFPDL